MVSDPASFSRSGRVALGAVFSAVALLTLRQVSSLDAGFHLRVGSSILAGEGWPRNDRFTYTVVDHPYIDTSWGYQVMLSLVERFFAGPGLVLFHTTLVLGCLFILMRTARLVPGNPVALPALLLVGALAAEMRFEVRPELLSYALLALVLYLLHRHAEGRETPLWLLPVCFLFWANVHSLFVLGFVALGAFVAGSWLRDRRPDRRLIGWAAAAVAVTLVNPYGIRGVLFPFTLGSRLDRTNVFAQGIGEFQSPFELPQLAAMPFHPWFAVAAYWVFFALAVLSLWPLLRRRRYAGFLLALPFLYLSARMMRNMPLLVVACLPGVAWAIPVDRVGSRRKLDAYLAWIVVAASLLLASAVYHDAYYIATRRGDRFGLGWNRETLPVAAAEYLERARPAGAGLNHLNFGGYLMWARDEPVFIDGRLEVIGEEFYRYYRRALASTGALEPVVRRYDIGWIVLPFKIERSLLYDLSSDSRWRLVYFDAIAAIFVRTDRFEPRLVDDSVRGLAAPQPTVELDSIPGLDLPRPAGWVHALSGLVRREIYPGEAQGLGLFHYFRRSPERAAPYFARAIRESDGAYYELYHNLGAALFRLGFDREALACFRIVVAAAPGNEIARTRVAELERRRPQTPEP